jgi:VanZ family protein
VTAGPGRGSARPGNPAQPRAPRAGRILVVLAYVGCIFALSSWKVPPPPPRRMAHLDKVAHAIEYGILGALLSWAAEGGAGPGAAGRRGRIALSALLGLGVGAADETYQRRVPGRESSLADLAADLIGAGVGAFLRERAGARARLGMDDE